MPVLTPLLKPVTLFDIEGDESCTKRRLIDAGERLMGTHGIDQPSLQDIAAEAGQGNKFAVQYHFGSREGLIDAIFALRMRIIQARRRELVDIAGTRGLADNLACLVEAVFIPMSEQIDRAGRHSYARMLLQYTSRIGFDPTREDDPFNARRAFVVTLMERMAALVGMDYRDFELSFYQQNVAMIVALVARDNMAFRGQRPPSLERLVDQTVSMTVPALAEAARYVRENMPVEPVAAQS
ncbi:MAG: TetR/AcrR family transcriptional regulator [Sphingobium sp.]